MPSVVSMPPNSRTAALEATSSVESPAASGARSWAAATASRSSANAVALAAVSSRPAAAPLTSRTIASYQPRTRAVPSCCSPSACMTTAAASGPANPRRSSPPPCGSSASSRRSVSSATSAVRRSRTVSRRNGRANGARWRSCSAPSRLSMLGPTTRAVEKRGSSTVNVASSRMTASARSRRVTSHASSTASHETGSRSRSRASSGCGSPSSSPRVAAAPTGKSALRVLRRLVERRDLVLGELQVGAAHVLLEVLDGARAGDREHHLAALQEPREGDLARRRAVRLGDLGDRPARLGQLAGGQREPRDEADALLLAVVEDVLGLAVGEVVEVLDGGDLEDLLRGLDLVDRDLREPEMAHLALVLELLHDAELLLARDLRVDAVQLPQVDRVDAETPQAHQAALAQVLGAADGRPDVRPVAREARLRGDGDPVVRMQRLADEVLGDVRAVGVGGVDEVDAELGQPLEDRDRLVVVGRIAPYPLAGDAHRAVSQTGDLEVAADLEGSGCRGCRAHARRVPREGASYPAAAMTAGSIPAAGASGTAVLDVERFEWSSPDQLELHGRWYGVRGLRFVRPTLMLRAEGVSRRVLATLEHKPWAALDGEPWVAAFPWQGEPLEFESVELAVTSAVVLELEPPRVPGAARRKKASKPGEAAGALLQERERARLERDAA